MRLQVKKFDESAVVPQYAHSTDAGMDLYALEHTVLKPQTITKVRTGIGIEAPAGYAYFVKDKSSIAQMGVTTLAGVVDAGYQGEIVVVAYNLNEHAVEFEKGQKFCQIVFFKIEQPSLELVADFTALSSRGKNGFGSTGTR